MGTALAGTRRLFRALAEHEGRLFAPWIAFATLFSASAVIIYPWLFPSAEERSGLALAVGGNPALGLIFGPAFDLMTDDGFNAWRSLTIGGFVAGLGAILAVTRATRGQVDSGQAELLASGVLGRSSRLVAAVGLALFGSVALGAVSGLVTVACGGGWEASLLLAATFTATGWFGAGLAAVAAQLGSDARTASSLAVGTFGGLFILRGFAYAVDAPRAAVWANPLGWMTETRPATGDHWWPLLPMVGLALVLLAAAFVLQSRRDFGLGLVAPRPGPARGSVRSTIGLAWRLNRGLLATWAVTFGLLGVVFGYFATCIHDLFAANPAIAGILAAGATSPDTLVNAFLTTLLSLVGIIAAVSGVQVIVGIRSEELDDRVEPVMATAVARPRYLFSHVAVAFAAPAFYTMLAGTIVGALASRADIGVTLGHVLLQAAATIPAVWTVVALSVAIVGARPVVVLAAWLGVFGSFILTLLGPTFKLPDWALAISPYWHIPNTGAAAPDYLGLLWISLFTLFFLAVGTAGLRRRDLAV
jgi:ABC-2 type transport system permease protein